MHRNLTRLVILVALAFGGSVAEAATIPLGSVSSASGSIVINNTGAPGDNTYLFTLTDHAQVSGNFSYNVVNGSIDIDLVGSTNVAHAVAKGSAFGLLFDKDGVPIGLTLFPPSPGLFSLADLGPGTYALSFTGVHVGLGLYSGSLTFAAALVPTPVPATLPLFASALGGLVFAGWRRRNPKLDR